MTDYLTGVFPENSRLIKIIFSERLKLQLDQVVCLGVVSCVISMSDAILGLWYVFFSNA